MKIDKMWPEDKMWSDFIGQISKENLVYEMTMSACLFVCVNSLV